MMIHGKKKQEKKPKIKKAIATVAKKQINAIKDWEEKHQDVVLIKDKENTVKWFEK